jgi:hypothetical protein
MSKDKRRLHDRSMQLLHTIAVRVPYGITYCHEYGIGPSKELSYLLDRKLVKIVRSRDRPTHRISVLLPTENGALLFEDKVVSKVSHESTEN